VPTSKTGNPWTTLLSKPVYENPWIKVDEHDVLNPRGKPGIYGVVHFKSRATGVVPIDDDGCTYLVGQYRYVHHAYSWEIPEGGGRLDEAPQAAAERELLEETGLTAGRWLEILQADLSNSVTDERSWAFVAWDLQQGIAEPEDTEDLQVRRVPFSEALGMAMRGEMRDALAMISLFKLKLLADAGQLPKDLMERLR